MNCDLNKSNNIASDSYSILYQSIKSNDTYVDYESKNESILKSGDYENVFLVENVIDISKNNSIVEGIANASNYENSQNLVDGSKVENAQNIVIAESVNTFNFKCVSIIEAVESTFIVKSLENIITESVVKNVCNIHSASNNVQSILSVESLQDISDVTIAESLYNVSDNEHLQSTSFEDIENLSNVNIADMGDTNVIDNVQSTSAIENIQHLFNTSTVEDLINSSVFKVVTDIVENVHLSLQYSQNLQVISNVDQSIEFSSKNSYNSLNEIILPKMNIYSLNKKIIKTNNNVLLNEINIVKNIENEQNLTQENIDIENTSINCNSGLLNKKFF